MDYGQIKDKFFMNTKINKLLFCLLYTSGLFLARIFKVDPSRRGVFINGVAFGNTVIIGFPVATALFGETATPDAMIYYMANTCLLYTS